MGDVEMVTGDKKFVIFLDIDGTLMGKDDAAFKRNLDIIGKVRSLGHKVLVNTGRSKAFLPEKIDFELYFDGVITGVGARIFLDGKVILCKLIDPDDVRKFCEICFKYENVCVLEGVEKMFYIGDDNEGHEEWIPVTKKNIGYYHDEDFKIEKYTVLGKAAREISEIFVEKYAVIQHENYAEIIQRGYTKAGAVKYVMDYLKLPREQSVAMGDSLNDLDMIEYAGIGVAMGNAVKKIKEIADMVTDSVDDAGVASALERVFNL